MRFRFVPFESQFEDPVHEWFLVHLIMEKNDGSGIEKMDPSLAILESDQLGPSGLGLHKGPIG